MEDEAEYVAKAMRIEYRSQSGENVESCTLQIDYRERIVRCKDCKRLIMKGEEFFINGNKAEREACSLFSDHDIDYDWTSFFYVKPDDFCAWGERRAVE